MTRRSEEQCQSLGYTNGLATWAKVHSKSNSIVACFSARCARTHYQGIVCFRHMACYPTVPIFFGSNCSHSLLRVLHTCCRFLCLTCLRYFSFARCARPHAQVIVGCRHVSSTRAGRLLYLSYLLYFPSVRCARTHSQSVVGRRHVSSTRAVGFLFVMIFFSSLRSHSLSVCCRLQARVFYTCFRFSICFIFLRLAALAPSVIEL